MSNLGRRVLYMYFVIYIIVNYPIGMISKLLQTLWVTVSYQSSCLFVVVFLTARKADTGGSSDKQYKVKKLQTGGGHPRGCNSHVSFDYFPFFVINKVSSQSLTFMQVYLLCFTKIRSGMLCHSFLFVNFPVLPWQQFSQIVLTDIEFIIKDKI